MDMHDFAITDCTAALLCGGKSSRMGFDKALLENEEGGLLLEAGAQKLAGLFSRVALVSNCRDKLACAKGLAGYAVLEDHYPGMGPLAGICTALEEAATPWVFVMACDMPSPDVGLIRQMYAGLPGQQVVLCSHDDKLEPLFAFYHQSCLPVFQQQLRENKPQPRREFGRLHVKTLPLTEEQAGAAFINLNTQEDLARWRAAAKTGDAP